VFSGSEAGSYVRLIDCVYHSTLGLRVMKKKKGRQTVALLEKSLLGLEGSLLPVRFLIARLFVTPSVNGRTERGRGGERES